MATATAERSEMTGPVRPRITVDVDPSLRREIRLEAAKRDVSIREYVTYLLLLGREAELASQGDTERSEA